MYIIHTQLIYEYLQQQQRCLWFCKCREFASTCCLVIKPPNVDCTVEPIGYFAILP